jgi:apolipoprotein D and lipocalin family protein
MLIAGELSYLFAYLPALHKNLFPLKELMIKNTYKYITIGIAAAASVLSLNLTSCVTIPKGAKAVRPFDRSKYLGSWYEIARMDFKFEKGLNHVTATYSLINDQTIRVDNKGYDMNSKKWKESIGKAKFVGNPAEARLKVSFFGPFYAGYSVIAIDPEYRYALIAGNNLKYMWLLSRGKSMPAQVRERYLSIAEELGYDTAQLVWTDQR